MMDKEVVVSYLAAVFSQAVLNHLCLSLGYLALPSSLKNLIATQMYF